MSGQLIFFFNAGALIWPREWTRTKPFLKPYFQDVGHIHGLSGCYVSVHVAPLDPQEWVLRALTALLITVDRTVTPRASLSEQAYAC